MNNRKRLHFSVSFHVPLFSIFFSKQIAIPTSIYLQNLASIQPRTSSPKFAEASKRYPPPVINLALLTSCTASLSAANSRSTDLDPVIARVDFRGADAALFSAALQQVKPAVQPAAQPAAALLVPACR